MSLKFNFKTVIGYSYNICATIGPVYMPACGQVSVVGRRVRTWVMLMTTPRLPPPVCKVPSNTMNFSGASGWAPGQFLCV